MFDHVKHVEGLTTIAHHVYDSIYYKFMIIAICNMQKKDMATQCVLSMKFNELMLKHGIKPNLKGSMVDNA
jgi:hypothetical protein